SWIRFVFFFLCHQDHRLRPSFPTRRSSDLHNRFLEATLVEYYVLALRIWFVALDRVERLDEAVQEHRELLGAIRDKDGSRRAARDRKSTRLNSSHDQTSYAVFCLKKKKTTT